jgi:glutamyl-tRNA synthetase
MIDKKYIYAYALKNAIEYEGKAQAGSIISGLFNCGLEKDKIKDVTPSINKILTEVNSWSIDKQKKEFEKYADLIGHRPQRVGLPELPDVPKSGVIMRFAPSPSGPLHIGHIISNMISSLYVEKYGGKFYVRIEDTNPETTIPEAYKNIKEDCDWIFGNVHEYIIQSDRIDIYYKYAEELIKKERAYVCTCPSEKFKKLVDNKKECPCRNLSSEENIKEWKKMIDKKGYKEGEAVLRFKTPNELGGIAHKNPAMRDFPLARINTKKHPRQGTKYRVWPLMNLSVSVDDIELKMTHMIRGKDHRDNAERQKMIFSVFNKKYPWTFFMGRIKFTDLDLSKRKIKKKIEEGEYSGFDDEKLPTIVSLRKRGYKPEAFAEFAKQRGLTQVDKLISQKEFFLVLDNFNKDM